MKSKREIRAVKVDANKRVIPPRSSIKPRYWRVNLGRKITGTVKKRRYFETEREANYFIQTLNKTLPRRGTAAFTIDENLAYEASTLVKELEPLNVTLADAVRFYVRYAPKRTNVRVSEVIPSYLAHKALNSNSYVKAQAISLNVFAREYGNKSISGIFHSALQSWFDRQGWKPLNLRNYMRDISMFFRWCKNNDYCTVNPMERVPRPRVTFKTPPIYSVDEARRLLEVAKETPKLALFEFVVFAFFTGVRVEELARMDWSMVVWNQSEICLPETVTKLARPRLVPISETLRSWFGEPPVKGPLFQKTNLRNRKQKLFDLAGINPKRNAFRHTFASYHAALYRNVSELQMILGQRTPSVLFTHYVTATRKEEACKFFALRPEALDS